MTNRRTSPTTRQEIPMNLTARLATIREQIAQYPTPRQAAQARFNSTGLPAADWKRIGA